jgi:hypothetical protein
MKRPHKNNLSAVSNGARLFAERMDLRTPRGRRFKDLIASYIDAVGASSITEAQRALIRDLAMMQVIHEDLQQEFLDSGELDHAVHSRVVNTMRNHMRSLGLFGEVTKKTDDDDAEMHPLDYINGKHKSMKRERINSDDEGD